MKGLIFDIRRFTIHDGPGIRTTIFFKGCPLRCIWCHNPESQRPEIEAIETETRLDGREFKKKLSVGQLMTVEEVFKEIKKDRIFSEESHGGVTFSGGEPMMQIVFLKNLLERCVAEGIHTTVDTCGYATPENYTDIAAQTNLFLYDLKQMDDQLHRKITGKSNAIILDNLKTLASLGKEIVIRFPFIPGLTSGTENVKAMIQFIKKLPGDLPSVQILPYHSLANNKYERLQMLNEIRNIPEVDQEDLLRTQKLFRKAGISILS
ncbi:MAG: glycyl-radical enzyme activating protein [Bacteroidales bacterium]|nr:glycyl-radical enzyme activating protein [Bacteroidales bacterium]